MLSFFLKYPCFLFSKFRLLCPVVLYFLLYLESQEYAMIISWHKKTKQDSNDNTIQINRSPKEIQQQDITFVLDLDRLYFDIYVNGILITKEMNSLHTFINLTNTWFLPFVSFRYVHAQMSFINDIPVPALPPGKADINLLYNYPPS